MKAEDKDRIERLLMESGRMGAEIGFQNGLSLAVMAIDSSQTLLEARAKITGEMAKVRENMRKAKERAEAKP